jgi:hypothetical protein
MVALLMSSLRPRTLLTVSLFGLVAALFMGCGEVINAAGDDAGEVIDATGDDAGALTGAFVGEVEGTSLMIGVVRDGDSLAAYVCGHADTLTTHTRWFSGSLGSDGETFTLQTDDWQLTGSLDEGGIQGALIEPGGVSTALSLAAAGPDTLSGLYSVMDSGCRAGLIVVDSGASSALLTQGAWCDGAGLVKQVTPMMPVALVEGGIQVMVEGSEQMQLTLTPHSL